jgi:ribosome-binding protein aMBF1 (putative translation factor)
MEKSPNTCKRYFSGDRVPDAESTGRLKAALGIDLNWLLNDSDTREGPVYLEKK